MQTWPHFSSLHTETRELITSLLKPQSTRDTSSGFIAAKRISKSTDFVSKQLLAKAILEAYDEYSKVRSTHLGGMRADEVDDLKEIVQSEVEVLMAI